MIGSFADKEGERLWNTGRSRRYNAIARPALRKLIQLNAAESLNDLKAPPGNQLEALSGNLSGHHSIRINRQWRICFQWTTRPENVSIQDYH